MPILGKCLPKKYYVDAGPQQEALLFLLLLFFGLDRASSACCSLDLTNTVRIGRPGVLYCIESVATAQIGISQPNVQNLVQPHWMNAL